MTAPRNTVTNDSLDDGIFNGNGYEKWTWRQQCRDYLAVLEATSVLNGEDAIMTVAEMRGHVYSRVAR